MISFNCGSGNCKVALLAVDSATIIVIADSAVCDFEAAPFEVDATGVVAYIAINDCRAVITPAAFDARAIVAADSAICDFRVAFVTNDAGARVLKNTTIVNRGAASITEDSRVTVGDGKAGNERFIRFICLVFIAGEAEAKLAATVDNAIIWAVFRCYRNRFLPD